jgi:type IV secretion system protein VirB10
MTRTLMVATLAIVSLPVFAQDQPVLTPRVSPTARDSQIGQSNPSPTGRPQQPAATAPEAPAANAEQHVESTPPTSFEEMVVPAGTRIPLTLKQGISTRNAHIGDPVYAQTSFPIVQNNSIVIPSGTFVQGTVNHIVRPGRVKGRAQIQMSFTSMIFPSGYTIVLPGAVQGTPGSKDTDIKGTEGTIQQTGSVGKDVQTIAATTIPGAAIGAIADGGKGAGIGAGVGGAVGLATVLLTRGPDIQLDQGASLEMVLERNIVINQARR